MVTFSNNRHRRTIDINNNVILRGGKQLLKLGINKRRKKAFLKNRNKLFASTIILPTSFQPQFMTTTKNSNNNNNSSSSNTNNYKDRTIPSTTTASFGKLGLFEKSSPANTSTSTSTNIDEKGKKKKNNISLKKLFRYKNRHKQKKYSSSKKDDGDDVSPPTNISSTKAVKESLADLKKAAKTKSLVDLDDISNVDVATPQRNNDYYRPTTPSTASTSDGLISTDPRMDSKKKEKDTAAYIFTDDDDEYQSKHEEKDHPSDEDEKELDREMKILDKNIHDQKVEERAIAEQQLMSTTVSFSSESFDVSQELVDNNEEHRFCAAESESDVQGKENDSEEEYSVSFTPSNGLYLQAMEGYAAKAKIDIQQATAFALSTIYTASPKSYKGMNEGEEEETDNDDYRNRDSKGDDDDGDDSRKEDDLHDNEQKVTITNNIETTVDEYVSKQRSPLMEEMTKTKGKQTRFCFLLMILVLIIPFILLMPKLIAAMIETPYNHDIMVDQARTFFKIHDESAKDRENPMSGIIVVVSETKSNLGMELTDRFERLGATVVSTEIDCNDLNSASKSIDSIVDRFHKIDFLIHTGNLCLWPLSSQSLTNNIKSITSTSVQGYDMIFAGNYISAFLMTQKLLPSLERSKFGTMVQFQHPASTVVDGSLLEIDNPSKSNPAASVLLQNQDSFFSALLHLPNQFAYAKLAGVLQHQVFVRDYPNIRTIELPLGWIDRGVNDFFKRLFQTESSHTANTGSIISSALINDEDLQDDLYDWSQRAIWKWLATDDKLTTGDWLKIGQRSTGKIAPVDKSEKNYVIEYLSSGHNAAMVTSTTLALMALKVRATWYAGDSTW